MQLSMLDSVPDVEEVKVDDDAQPAISEEPDEAPPPYQAAFEDTYFWFDGPEFEEQAMEANGYA
jgi:hypothetical protein